MAFVMGVFPQTVAFPTWVFDVRTVWEVWMQVLWFLIIPGIFIVWLKLESLRSPIEWLGGLIEEGLRIKWNLIKVSVLVGSLMLALIVPATARLYYAEMQINENKYACEWLPATLPSIEYTNWAYQTDEIEVVDSSTISAPDYEVFKQVRIFNLEAARLRMKPEVGEVIWLSIDLSDIDICYKDDVEYWVAVLTLKRPPLAPGTEWVSDHLLYTHSERILIIDAASTEVKDFMEVYGLEGSPQLYYGEGGMWKDIDEVYVKCLVLKKYIYQSTKDLSSVTMISLTTFIKVGGNGLSFSLPEEGYLLRPSMT
jgi:hypothetical protein